MNTVKLLPADDHEFIRRRVRNVLASRRNIRVVGEASSAPQLLKKSKRLKPHVIIMGLDFSQMDGIEAIRKLRCIVVNARVVVLTSYESVLIVKQALEAGASAYVLKSDLSDRLEDAIEAALSGRKYVSPTLTLAPKTTHLLQSSVNQDASALPLTARERQVLEHLAQGKSSKEIAAMLQITTRTVETHRANMMRKLDLHSVTELFHFAFVNKLIKI